MIEKEIEWLKSRKVFTTSEATKFGIDKKRLKALEGVVCLGTFPQEVGGYPRLESFWTYDQELDTLAKSAKKIKKHGQEATKNLVNRVEEIVREKLGFNVETKTEEPMEKDNAESPTVS